MEDLAEDSLAAEVPPGDGEILENSLFITEEFLYAKKLRTL